MFRPSTLGLACAFTFALAAAAPGPATAGSAAPVVTDLGNNHLPQSVSDDGGVVAGLLIVYDGGPGDVGVSRWTPATGTEYVGGLATGRPDVSANGAVIAGTVMTDRPEAAFWQNGGWHPLGEFPMIPPLPGWHTVSNAISANGQRLAGATTPPPVDFGHVRAFSFNPDTWDDRWADFGWTELPRARKASFAEASGISNDGLVQVGISTDLGGAYRAVRWTDGRVKELLDTHGQRLGGESVRCNSRCDVVVGGGGGSSAVNPILAWRLPAGGRYPACYFRPHSGPPLPALRYYAYGTDETGNVVIGAYYYDEIPPGGGWARNIAKGWLWIGDERGGTMHELHTYLSGLGQDYFEGWLNVVPTGVSGDGRYLVGWGDDAEGVLRGWRIDFGAMPTVRGPAADYTACPTSRLTPPPRTASAAGTGVLKAELLNAGYRDLPSGEFRSKGGQRYHVQMRGMRVYGGARAGALAELVSLGGDHYYDPVARLRLSFVRDRAGFIQGVRERRGRSETTLQRMGD